MQTKHPLKISVVVNALSRDREIEFWVALDAFVEAFIRDHVEKVRAEQASCSSQPTVSNAILPHP